MERSGKSLTRVRVRAVRAGAIVAIAGGALAGCGGKGQRPVHLSQPPARTTDSVYEIAATTDAMRVGAMGGAPPPVREIDESEARAGVDEVMAISGTPRNALFEVGEDAAPGQVGEATNPSAGVVESTLVDAVVGQINGKPVFAMEFLEPMDARLRAEAQRLAPQQWRDQAVALIQRALVDRIRDELLIAEFESSLTLEERVGLLFLVEQIRTGLISEARGSEELLRRQLQEEEGLTIEEKVRLETQREKAFAQLRRVLGDKAYVAWREIVAQFRRDQDLFNPPDLVSMRMIEVNAQDAAALEAVTAALASGAPFEEIARLPVNGFLPDAGGRYEAEAPTGGLRGARLFGVPELNEAVTALEVGGVAGPIETRGRVFWVKLESIEKRSKSLYEVQLQIHDSLRRTRLEAEEQKYFASLIERSSLSDVREMVLRLLEVAERRYLGAKAGAG